jgi:hypothetical protein
MVAKTVHTIMMTLQDVKPKVWRRIEVQSEIGLGELSPVLEEAMGWMGSHLHMYQIDGEFYSRHSPGFEPIGLDEAQARLGDVLPQVGMKIVWEYDLGDGWRHDLLLEGINVKQRSAAYPRCLDGARACPPEDCGGPWGYRELLAAVRDRSHPQHDELREWMPAGFDPGHFDAAETTARMQAPVRFDTW